jgi:hypothetical protein
MYEEVSHEPLTVPHLSQVSDPYAERRDMFGLFRMSEHEYNANTQKIKTRTSSFLGRVLYQEQMQITRIFNLSNTATSQGTQGAESFF